MSMIANINKSADAVPVAFGKLGTGGGLLFVAICAWFGPTYIASFSHRTLPPPQQWQAMPGGIARKVPATGSPSNNTSASSGSAATSTPAPAPVPATVPNTAPVQNTAPSVSVSPPAYRYVAPAPVPPAAPPVVPAPRPAPPSFVQHGYSIIPRNPPRVPSPASGPIPYRPMPLPFPRGMYRGGFGGGFGGFGGGGFHSFGGGRRR